MSLKGFGLVLPAKKQEKKAASATVSRSAAVKSVFREDSDDDDDELDGRKQVNYALLMQAEKAKNNKKLKRDMEAALEQDSTVYQYDEVYDEMAEERVRSDPRFERLGGGSAVQRKSKYIDKLKHAATERKKLEDVRLAHKLQREREDEDDEFAGKEEFVTTAYKKKLEEVRIQEELDRRQTELEAKNDVTKKGDLSGFYRNLLSGNVAMGTASAPQESSKGAIARDETRAAESSRAPATPPREPSPSGVRSQPSASHSPPPPTYQPPAFAGASRDESEEPAGGLDTRRFDERRRREQEARAARPRDRDDRHRRHDDDSAARRGRSRSPPPGRRPSELATDAEPSADEIAAKFGRRTTDDAAQAARERYLARKRERKGQPKPVMD